MDKFNDIQIIKRRMYALRNGVIADTLRKAGLPYKFIFGLNLPQISEVAAETGTSEELAEAMRADVKCRESQLLAPMLYPVEKMTVEKATDWVGGSETVEAIDILCHRLLKKMPEAREVAAALSESERDLDRYAALRLTFNILNQNLSFARSLAERELEKNCRLTSVIARQILEEISFLEEN